MIDSRNKQIAIVVISNAGYKIQDPAGNTKILGPLSTARFKIAFKSLGRRYLELHDEIADLDAIIIPIVDELAPALVARNSIGHGTAAQLLQTAGDNVERLQSEASFAALCGVSPVPASSGKTTRLRLNRGGDRAANSALHIIALGRLRTDPRTKRIWRSASPKGIQSSKLSDASNVTLLVKCLP